MSNSTTLELRDRLAGFMGYVRHEPPDGGEPFWTHESSRYSIYVHPIPLTLDGAAAAMPQGWRWVRKMHEGQLVWDGYKMNHSLIIFVDDTGDEIADRLALAVKCWEAEAASR